MQFGAIPIVFADSYGFNLQQCGAVFTCRSNPRLDPGCLVTQTIDTDSYDSSLHRNNHLSMPKYLPGKTGQTAGQDDQHS